MLLAPRGEIFQGLGGRGYTLGEKLESDEASEFGVFCLINHAHPAAAEFLNNSVMGYGLAEHGLMIVRGCKQPGQRGRDAKAKVSFDEISDLTNY
jgi:hypothetical protein